MKILIGNLFLLTFVNLTKSITSNVNNRLGYLLNKPSKSEQTIKLLSDVIVELKTQIAGVDIKDSLNNMKILILGAGNLSSDIIYGIAEIYGYGKDKIEIENDYDANKYYDLRKLQFSSKYKSIFIGPIAHKVTGLGDNNSVIHKFQNEPGFPPIQILRTKSGTLKITKTALKEAFITLLGTNKTIDANIPEKSFVFYGQDS